MYSPYFLFQAFSVKCFDFHNETVNLLLVVHLVWTNVCSHVKSTQSFHCYLVMLLNQGNVFDNIFVMSMRATFSVVSFEKSYLLLLVYF